jgi:hypothetical protein
MADEFRTVIESNSGRLAPDFDQFSQRAHDASGRQAGVDLDLQRLTVEIIEHVEGAKPAPAQLLSTVPRSYHHRCTVESGVYAVH